MSAVGARLALPFRMVRRRPLRSALAALGLAVTLSSMLVAVAVANKGKQAALDEIRQIGANVLTVSAEASRLRGGRERSRDVVHTLTLADERALVREVSHVDMVAAEFRSVVPVKTGDLSRQASISGMQPSYASLRQAPMKAGRFFDETDDAEGKRVAVIGGRLAIDLFPDRDPIGATIRIRSVPFTIIGVFNQRGTGLDAFDEDEVVFIPLRTAMRRVFQADYVHRLFIRVDERASLDAVSADIEASLRARHHTGEGSPDDFRVQDQRRLVTLRETSMSRLRMFQAAVSITLLFTGALGILALQLMSVRERRAEIGTRRAIGATREMIFGHFLLEGAAVCVLGAAGGVVIAAMVARVAGLELDRSLTLVAFGVCCAAGVLASVAPALRAAFIHPAVALRG